MCSGNEGGKVNSLLRCGLELSVGLVIVGCVGEGAEPVRFKSPSGRHEVAFEEIEHKKYSEAEQQRDFNFTSHIKYLISFYRAGEAHPVAQVEYRDVYGWEKDAAPTPPTDLFKAILWSPNEDFAVLDEEGWARAPGAPERRAVALNASLSWSTAPFRLSDPVWADTLHVIGNAHNDCDYSVVEFEGTTGKMRSIMASASPIGYEIATTTGRRVLIRKALDNCRMEDAEKAFVPECFSLSLDTMQRTAAPCDAGR